MSQRHYGNDEHPEVAAAMRRHAEEEQRRFLQDQKDSDRRWVEFERNREMEAAQIRKRPSGHWLFEEILNSSGGLIGWNVRLDNRSVGILLLRGDDIVVLSTSTDHEMLRRLKAPRSADEPYPEDIMAAFLKLYPGGAREAAGLPRGQRQLPAENFGPPRDWSEE